MKNPWLEINENYREYSNDKNFILADEKKIVAEFNRKNKNEAYKIHQYILPFPYLGNVKNPQILILLNNPGFDIVELENGYYKKFHNEILESYEGEKPLYCLDDEYVKFSNYWSKKLNTLIIKVGKEVVSSKIGIINYFPYSSSKFKDFYKKDKIKFLQNGFLKSQEYNFELIKKAIDLEALIIVVRGKKNWFNSIKELENCENMYQTNSYLNSSITANNCKGFYDKILERLEKR